MTAEQQDMRIPTERIPICPICGAPMTMNLRCDDSFVQDAGWHAANSRYHDFLLQSQRQRVLFFELGVGANTPGIIKFPFWQMTARNPRSLYVCINDGEAFYPREIETHSIGLNADIGQVVESIACRTVP